MMKFLILLTLVTLAFTWDDDHKMTKQWEKMKALESCWGEENMKLYTVNIKKAIATCTGQDAPELFLPPYRSSYRLINTLINGADKMENEQYDLIEKMIHMMRQQQRQRQRPSYTYSGDYNMDSSNDNWMEQMKMKFMMKQMMEKFMDKSDSGVSSMSYRQQDQNRFNSQDMMKMFSSMFGDKMDDKMDTYRMPQQQGQKEDPMSRMAEFFKVFTNNNGRSKRAVTNPSLDLGDRLVEKLNEQKKEMEAKIGNMTCVLKEMNYIDANNKLDIRAMKRDMEQYTMPSPWFAQRYEELIDTCYDMATNLPTEIEENAVVTGEGFGEVNLAEIKSFKKCCAKAETRLCMNHDIKKKIETNFGPLEDILAQTKLTEYQIFPLVIQLLHGQEMEYMMGEF